MNILDLVVRLNVRAFLKERLPAIDLDIKKIVAVALKVFIIANSLQYKYNAFSAGFTAGLLAKFITKLDFKLNDLNKMIDKDPLQSIQAAILSFCLLYPKNLEPVAISSGFYSGLYITKLCK